MRTMSPMGLDRSRTHIASVLRNAEEGAEYPNRPVPTTTGCRCKTADYVSASLRPSGYGCVLMGLFRRGQRVGLAKTLVGLRAIKIIVYA
jgi:hypothetical protein